MGIERGKERDREGKGKEREKGERGGVGREGKRKSVCTCYSSLPSQYLTSVVLLLFWF